MITLPGTARPIDHYLGQATPCLQSQIGQDRDLRRQGTVPVEVAVALSRIVRRGPVMTAVNGTFVARPGEDDGGISPAVSAPARP
jgi:hypothetical protein